MLGIYEYFFGVRYYFILESLVVLGLLLMVMVRFGQKVQGGDPVRSWASPKPASRVFAYSALSLWLAGSTLVPQGSRFLMVLGICLIIAGIQLAFHVNLVLMGVWYLSQTGRPMMGLGGLSSRDRHKKHLEKAKLRGKVCLEKAKHPWPIIKVSEMKWQ